MHIRWIQYLINCLLHNLKEASSLQIVAHHCVVVEVPWQWKPVSLDRSLELAHNSGKGKFITSLAWTEDCRSTCSGPLSPPLPSRDRDQMSQATPRNPQTLAVPPVHSDTPFKNISYVRVRRAMFEELFKSNTIECSHFWLKILREELEKKGSTTP